MEIVPLEKGNRDLHRVWQIITDRIKTLGTQRIWGSIHDKKYFKNLYLTDIHFFKDLSIFYGLVISETVWTARVILFLE